MFWLLMVALASAQMFGERLLHEGVYDGLTTLNNCALNVKYARIGMNGS